MPATNHRPALRVRRRRLSAGLDVDVVPTARVVEVHDAGHEHSHTLVERVLDARRRLRAHDTEDRDDPRQFTDRCAECGPELHRSAAKVWWDWLAEDHAAAVGVVADQLGRGPGPRSKQAAVREEMLE